MLSSLPSLTPRDSYKLWYTSNSHSSTASTQQEPGNQASDLLISVNAHGHNMGTHPPRRAQQSSAYRSPLGRLRADELYMERRKQNVQNYGSSWIKPPGVFKSLHQIREERREMEEHQEAVRRERLVQEMAEAEGANDLLHGDGPHPEMEEVRDMDDEIPEADSTRADFDESDTEGDEDPNEQIRRGLPAQPISEDAYREALIDRRFGAYDGSITDEDANSQMLQEEDLVHEQQYIEVADVDMGMGGDLDIEVPEADFGGYEHTDTEAELSSSDEDESIDTSSLPQELQFSASMVRSDGTQSSLNMNSMDLRSGSSLTGSSPRSRGDLSRHARGRHS